jgi:hypothetical protein
MDRKLSAGIQVLQLIETFVFVLLTIRIQHSRSDDESPEPHNIAPLHFFYNPEQACSKKLNEAVWTTSQTCKDPAIGKTGEYDGKTQQLHLLSKYRQ